MKQTLIYLWLLPCFNVSIFVFFQKVSAPLVVIVEDTNDNPPTFSQDQFIFHIEEEPPTQSLVGRVVALDPDGGLGGQIDYYIKPGEGSDAFTITGVNNIYYIKV